MDGQSEAGSFRTAPGASAKELSFYAYGDTRANHYLWGPVNDHENVCKAIMSDMSGSALRQTLILNDGDVVRHGLDEAYWDTQYFNRCYPGQMQLESTLPIMTSIGNHECYLSNCAGIDSVIGGQLLLKYWPYAMFPRNDRFYYSFDYGPIHVAVVDTWMHRDYTPGTDQYEWLSKDLDSAGKAWKIVFMHTPAWDCMFVDDDIINGLTPLFTQKGVRLVIAERITGMHAISSRGLPERREYEYSMISIPEIICRGAITQASLAA
ncbi:MAG: metallophosphoesterase [Candidatus Eremiobacteraeota bacterium]|nr:metallophosphoesterase [Candidatus Eremiobacteraeota bacterium]